MPYTIKETPRGVTLEVKAPGRDELVRETLHGALEALYGSGGPTAVAGQTVPIQAAGVGLDEALKNLLGSLLLEAGAAPGVLGSPVWLAFDEGRVTATLSVLEDRRPARPLRLVSTRVEGANAAEFVFAGGPAVP